MKVHSALGPGLLESAYAVCLKHELMKRGLKVASEVPLPVVYDGIRLEAGYRLDLVVEDTVVVELKAIEVLAPIHQAQIISYLRQIGRASCRERCRGQGSEDSWKRGWRER